MKDMIAQALPANPWILLILLSFVGIFLTIVFNVMRPSRRSSYDADSRLPLEENEEVSHHA
jgi:cbb3-type cytochrome oxidase subunit 3